MFLREEDQGLKELNRGKLLRFVLPSLLGLFLFMTPVSYAGDLTIPVAFFAKYFQSLIASSVVGVVTFLIVFMAIVSLAFHFKKPASLREDSVFYELLDSNRLWLFVRLIGGVSVFLSYFQLGPKFIWNENTGGLVLHGLLPTLFSIFIFAGLLLPLLLNFGLLELFGTLLSRVMRPLFNLLGRSAIDCMASWLGDGSIGILMTSKQYEDRFYTQREAAVIGTTFSAVSITFSLVVIAQVGLEHMFLEFYLAVCLAGLLAAIIVPRLPPLSLKKNLYVDGVLAEGRQDVVPSGFSTFSWGLKLALDRASEMKFMKDVIGDGAKNVLEMVLGVLPVVMGLGTLALLIAEYTPVFDLLGMPFIPLLKLLGVPEATAASQTIVVGFADMFIPSILAASIQSEMTRFVIAAVSVTQLIYMSEVGALLLGSKIPVSFSELFMIFILRSLVTLPVIAGLAHLMF